MRVLILDTGVWILKLRAWIIDVRFWTLDVGLNVGLDLECNCLNAGLDP